MGPKCQNFLWSPSVFVRNPGEKLPHGPSPAQGEVLCLGCAPGGQDLHPGVGNWCCRQPFPSQQGSWAGSVVVLGVSGHLSREAAGNGNCLVENNHNLVTGAYFSNRNVLTWNSPGAEGQRISSCKLWLFSVCCYLCLLRFGGEWEVRGNLRSVPVILSLDIFDWPWANIKCGRQTGSQTSLSCLLAIYSNLSYSYS